MIKVGDRVVAIKDVNPDTCLYEDGSPAVGYDVCVAGMTGTVIEVDYFGTDNVLVAWDEPRETNDFPMFPSELDTLIS